ncbi:MAG: TonB-dependent receptor [Saprospiraceae bacterium]
MIFINQTDVLCQAEKTLTFQIFKNSDCTATIERFKREYDILVAYSPTLVSVKSTQDVTLKAATPLALFEKICHSYQLEYSETTDHSLLVRSDIEDIMQSAFMTVHINIKDISGSYPVSFALVYDDSGRYFGFTDDHGDCFLKIPKAMNGANLNVHSLAHKDAKFKVDMKDVFTQVELYTDPIKVIPVTINTFKRKLSFTKQQGTEVSDILLQKLTETSIFTHDVMRSVQLLPGVQSSNDSKSSVRIRGANEEATLLILDNMPIYKADHFYGLFGAFNSNYIHKLTLYKNNIPVSYGGRTSGMLQIESAPSIVKTNIVADINLLNAGITADIPISKNWLFKFSGRTTYTDLLQTGLYDVSQRDNLPLENKMTNIQNLIVSKPVYNFSDLNSRIVFSMGNHRFDANLFSSRDLFDDQYDISFKFKNQVINEEVFSQASRWNNDAFGFNYEFSDPNQRLMLSLYNSSYSSSFDINSNLTRREIGGFIKDTVNVLNTNHISDTGGKVSLQWKKFHQLLIGAEHIIHDNDLNIQNGRSTILEVVKKEQESSLFSSINLGNSTGFSVQPSLRSTYIYELNQTYVLPQIYVSYAVNNSSLFKASASRHMQYIRQFEHENALGQKQQFFSISNGNSIPVGVAKNYMAGFRTSFDELRLDVEAYFRTLDGTLIHATLTPGLRTLAINQPFKLFNGESWVVGVDVSLIYEKKSLFSMLNYTLSKAENRFAEIFDNQYFPSSEDSRHQIKWVNIYSYRKLDFTLNYVGATGRPYLDLSSLTNQVNRRNLDVTRYIRTLSAYHRWDVGVSYKFKILNTNSTFGFSVFNLTNRVNVKYRQFVYQISGGSLNAFNTVLGSDVSQLDRTYNVSWRIQISR